MAQSNGLKADYFDNIDFTNLKLTRTDPTLNFNWGNGSPTASIGADTFSARWTGQVLAPTTSEYTFYTTADDGIRLWVNGQQIINNYVDQAPTTKTGKISLAANQKYDIKVEYYERGGGAVAKLEWSTPTLARQVIAQANLFNTTAPTNYNYTEALQKSLYFYDAQRSGDLPDNYRVEWRGDSALKDGSDVGKDLAGGWYDAGDRIKFSRTIAYTVSMLSWGYLKTPDVYQASGQQPYLLDSVKWATDYLIKAFTNTNAGSYEFYTQVGSMGSGPRDDHNNWVAAEVIDQVTDRPSYKINTATPDSSIAGTTAAAFAAASVMFRQTGNAAYADLLLDRAEKMFDFADRYRGINQQLKPNGTLDSPSVGVNTSTPYTDITYYDELLWGSTWVHRAKLAQNNGYGNQYLTRAEAIYNDPNAGIIRGNFVEPQSWQWVDKGAKVILAELTGKAVYKTEVQNYLDYWTIGYNNRQIQSSPGGLAWQSQWGSLRFATTQSFIALAYSDQITDPGLKQRYLDFARAQVNYALGDNPYNRSYVLGFGSNPMQSVHHSTAFGRADGWDSFNSATKPRHILYGGLLGGPDVQDKFTEDVTNYVTNEVALDYNAGYTGAIARLAKLYGGGSALTNFPTPAARTDQYFVEAALNSSGSNFVEIKARVNNQSAWPAKFSDKFVFRYYFTLDNGVDPTKLTITTQSIQAKVLGRIRQYSGSIYYAELDLTGTRIFPGGSDPARNYEAHYRKELTFRITSPTAWVSSNDWSYSGLTGSLTKSNRISLYDNGLKRFGIDP
jgi:endoglucanase